MHIKPVETGPSGSGRPDEGATTRKLRLGGATRVPIHGHAKATDSPLRVLVSAIGQSLGTRTPLRNQSTVGASVAKSSLSSSYSSSKSSNAAVDSKSSTSSSGGRMNTNHFSTAKIAAPAVPATPIASKVRIPVKTPSRRTSLSSSTSSISSSSSTGKKVSSTPSTKKSTSSSSTTSGKLDPVTPVSRRSSIPRTPNALKNSTTPNSASTCIPLPTPRRKSLSSTPGPKLISTPGQTRSKSIFPTTPVSKPSTPYPSTPVNCENSGTPHNSHSSNPAPFYTPQSSLPPTPLQPRNHNASDSSRKLHFGINAAAMADQENTGSKTPKPHTPSMSDATFSFDKNRLAQIKARRNAAQMLKSPAQRIRVPDFQQPPQSSGGRVLQQLAEDRSARFDEDKVGLMLSKTPTKRRVANSLF